MITIYPCYVIDRFENRDSLQTSALHSPYWADDVDQLNLYTSDFYSHSNCIQAVNAPADILDIWKRWLVSQTFTFNKVRCSFKAPESPKVIYLGYLTAGSYVAYSTTYSGTVNDWQILTTGTFATQSSHYGFKALTIGGVTIENAFFDDIFLINDSAGYASTNSQSISLPTDLAIDNENHEITITFNIVKSTAVDLNKMINYYNSIVTKNLAYNETLKTAGKRFQSLTETVKKYLVVVTNSKGETEFQAPYVFDSFSATPRSSAADFYQCVLHGFEYIGDNLG